MIKVSEYSVNSDVTEYSDDRLLSLLGELPMPRKKSTGSKPMLTVLVSTSWSYRIWGNDQPKQDPPGAWDQPQMVIPEQAPPPMKLYFAK